MREDVEFFTGHAKHFKFENGVNSPIRAKFYQVGQIVAGFDLIILPENKFLHKLLKSAIQMNMTHHLHKVKICIKITDYLEGYDGLIMKVLNFDLDA